MAKVNKPQAIASLSGMPPLNPKGAMLAAGPDNVPAVIQDQAGNPKGPAMIKEGEIVFSVEAVIGAGDGDYDQGAKRLLAVQEQLRQEGMKYLEQGSLSAAPGPAV